MPASPAKVNILLSTYNGEKYLPAQLESLLAQTWKPVTIYIRDDGSTDGTLSVLKTYAERSVSSGGHRIILLDNPNHQNLGYMQSFWTLLCKSEPADYYAFCDQDDYWLPNKIESGVLALSKESASLPLLYSSSFTYCDDFMRFTGNPTPVRMPVTLKDVLYYTPAFGFTILINRTLRDLALSASSLDNIPHDGWCQKIAASMGKFVYDSTQTAKYRRHDSTVTYADSDRLKLIGKWLKNDILGIGLREYRFVLQRFYEEYHARLGTEDLELLELFMKQPGSPSAYGKRLFYPKRLRPTLGGELALRLCFLLNR